MKVQESILRDMLRMMIWYPIRWMASILPVSMSFRGFRWFGFIHAKLSARKTGMLKMNMQRAFPGTQSKNLQRQVLLYLQTHYTDRLHIFTYPKLLKNEEIFKDVAIINGLDHLDGTLKKNNRAIIVLGHFGVLQLPLFRLGQLGYKIIQIGMPTAGNISWVGRYVSFRLRLQYEAMIPARIMPANRFLRPVFEHLKTGGIVMMNIDPAGGGLLIGRMIHRKFLGQKIPIPLGSIELSEKTQTPILPLSVECEPSGRWIYTIHPPLNNGNPADPEKTLEELIPWYEQQITRQPGLWHFWDEFEPGKLILTD